MSDSLRPRRGSVSYSMDFKLELVEKSYQPRACVAQLAENTGLMTIYCLHGASATATFCPTMKYNVQSVNLDAVILLWYLTCPCHIMQYHTMNHPVPLLR